MPKQQRNTPCSTVNSECTSNEVKKYPDSITKALLHNNQHNFNSNFTAIYPQIIVKNKTMSSNAENSFNYGIKSLHSPTFNN